MNNNPARGTTAAHSTTAKDRKSPDPGALRQFCRALADTLTSAGVRQGLAGRVEIGDLLGERRDQHGADLDLLGAVTVIVRNSLLEHVHAVGPLSGADMKFITTRAAGPVAHFLAAPTWQSGSQVRRGREK